MGEHNTRPVMTSAELSKHEVRQYGRDYSESDDGYGDMAAEEGRGWRAVPGWGADGWDLGSWPYVVFYLREESGRFEAHDERGRHELMVICEGDRTVYRFVTAADRAAATDYLFLWHSADEDWSPVTYEARAALDAGELAIDERFRGPFSWKRAGVTTA